MRKPAHFIIYANKKAETSLFNCVLVTWSVSHCYIMTAYTSTAETGWCKTYLSAQHQCMVFSCCALIIYALSCTKVHSNYLLIFLKKKKKFFLISIIIKKSSTDLTVEKAYMIYSRFTVISRYYGHMLQMHTLCLKV